MGAPGWPKETRGAGQQAGKSPRHFLVFDFFNYITHTQVYRGAATGKHARAWWSCTPPGWSENPAPWAPWPWPPHTAAALSVSPLAPPCPALPVHSAFSPARLLSVTVWTPCRIAVPVRAPSGPAGSPDSPGDICASRLARPGSWRWGQVWAEPHRCHCVWSCAVLPAAKTWCHFLVAARPDHTEPLRAPAYCCLYDTPLPGTV